MYKEKDCVIVSAVTPKLHLGDPQRNAVEIIDIITDEVKKGTNVVVFPELCLTGYSCGDMFAQTHLIKEAEKGVSYILKEITSSLIQIMGCNSQYEDIIYILGAPIQHKNNLFNCAVVCKGDRILGIVPKTHLPNYNEFYEKRWFASGADVSSCEITYAGQSGVTFSNKLLFQCKQFPEFCLGVEICEDLWSMSPPSVRHAQNGATVIANLSASNETIGKADYRRQLIGQLSARCNCGYVYASAGVDESTTDVVFSGHNLIYENGTKLVESELFQRGIITTAIDVAMLAHERSKLNHAVAPSSGYTVVKFNCTNYPSIEKSYALRKLNRTPFVPSEAVDLTKRCQEILAIQAQGLARRFSHTKADKLVLGVSGGLDSTLALIVCMKALDILNLPYTHILGVTMPGFGTTKRTKNNAVDLLDALGIPCETISIVPTTTQHLADISHDISITDVTYENAQARERTQILMDLANKHNGLVVGTGDLSELALGWCTYNGDHMSMYAVNASIPKTLVRSMVCTCAAYDFKDKAQRVLLDIVNTPVSPELLPPDENGKIAQVTEDSIGPYALHDFFLYHMLRFGSNPNKIFKLAVMTFEGTYDVKTIAHWLLVFYRRFFNQQFKRSCMPDGPKVGSICLSPRGDLRMPSDMVSTAWLREVEAVQRNLD